MRLYIKYLVIISCIFISTLSAAKYYFLKNDNKLAPVNIQQEPIDTIASMQEIKSSGPNIVFNTVPKSGSVYVSKTLENSLNYKHETISAGYFPSDNIIFDKADDFFKSNGLLTQEHLDASPVNIQLINKFTDRMVLHFRDPRQVLLSWVHHMNTLNRNGQKKYLYYVTPTPPEEYYSWELSKQIDWNIENFLPEVVEWMNKWLEYKDQEDKSIGGFKILLTTYDELLKDELGFCHKILDFYAIDKSQVNFIFPAKNMGAHFRKGDPNEWREVFTQSQKDRISQIIPEQLLKRFNWVE